jgi:2TM domain
MKVKYRRQNPCVDKHTPESFKKHLNTYIAVNAFLWLLWLSTSGFNSYPWPVYTTLWWGVGLFFHALKVAPVLYAHQHTQRKEEDEFI